MSVRRVDDARLEAAGWTVTVDRPWLRLAAAVTRWARRPVKSDELAVGPAARPARGVGPVGGWSR